MKPLSITPEALTAPRKTDGGTQLPALPPASKPTAEKLTPAKAAALRLFNLLPPLDVVDPESFMSATVAIFAGYPPAMLPEAIEQIARRHDRPTLKQISAICGEIYAPEQRRLERKLAMENHRRSLPPPRAPRTPEEQARIDAAVADAFRKLGLDPEAGTPPKRTQAPPASRGDGKHGARVAADLAARAERRKQGIEQ